MWWQITPCEQVGRLVAATRWGDTLLWQIASCVLENFWENLCLCNGILSLQQVAKNQIRLNLCDLLRRQNSVAATKIFTKILQYTHEAICCCDVSPNRVAANCRLVCTDLKRKENEITTAVSRTYENATHIIAWFALGVVTREHKCPLIVSFCFQFLPWSLFWFKTLCLTRC